MGHGRRDKNRYNMNTEKPPTSFGAWVRARRRQLDLTQAELGRHAGCSEAAIRKIEADERKPSRQLAELLAQALKIHSTEVEQFLRYSRGLISDAVVLGAEQVAKHNLPVLLTSTVDRTQDLTTVLDLLNTEAIHLVTLIGPPGIGKTRLSIHCGTQLVEAFPDGVWFVDLADVREAVFWVPAVARCLPGLGLPPAPDLNQLILALQSRRLLLILDNVEQIVELVGLEVARILGACPHVKVLATSRVPLHLYGEQEYALPPLSTPPKGFNLGADELMRFEAVQLFGARARQHQLRFAINAENARAVQEICTILEGIPLALELAAATLRQLSLTEMAAMLKGLDGENWLARLATPARDLPERQRTLANVIEWSYILLNGDLQVLFTRLGVFVGWFGTPDAAAVCEVKEVAVARALHLLREHSLLVVESSDGVDYWRMPVIIREFALAKLPMEERKQAEALHAEFYVTDLQAQARVGRGAEHFRRLVDNFHAALKCSITRRPENATLLVRLLEPYWGSQGYFREGLALTRQLLDARGELKPQMNVELLEIAADLAWQQHDFDTALAYAQGAVEAGWGSSLPEGMPRHLNRLGRIYIEQGRYKEAEKVLRECLGMAEGIEGTLSPGIVLAQLGEIAFFERRLEDGRDILEEALTRLPSEEAIFIAISLTDLAEIALAEGDLGEAFQRLRQGFGAAGSQMRRSLVHLCALAGYLVAMMKLEQAVRFCGAIKAWIERSGVTYAPFYRELLAQRMEAARVVLPEAQFEAALEAGGDWSWEQVLRAARAELDLE